MSAYQMPQQPTPFCRLLVKAEIFNDLTALANRAQNPLSVSQALFQGPSKKLEASASA